MVRIGESPDGRWESEGEELSEVRLRLDGETEAGELEFPFPSGEAEDLDSTSENAKVPHNNATAKAANRIKIFIFAIIELKVEMGKRVLSASGRF